MPSAGLVCCAGLERRPREAFSMAQVARRSDLRRCAVCGAAGREAAAPVTASPVPVLVKNASGTEKPACRLGGIEAQLAAIKAAGKLTFAELCRAGNPAGGNSTAAQGVLGSATFTGRRISTVNVSANKRVAFKWFERAAKQGLAMAQFNLGCCYRKGEGVAQSHRALRGQARGG